MKQEIGKGTFVQDGKGIVGRPGIREIVQEASRSLAVLDAARLEELAQSCEELNRESQLEEAARRRLTLEARQSRREMMLLASVLDVTRANLRILRTLKSIQSSRFEYAPLQWRD